MNNIKKLVFCLFLTLIIGLPLNVFAKTKTFTFMGKHQLTIDVPKTFKSKVQKNKNVDFDSVKKPKKVAACLLNQVLSSNNLEVQQLFVEKYNQGIIKKFNVDKKQVEEGSDEILGHNVPYILFPDPTLPVTQKIIYLINDHAVFIMTITFESDAPFADIENLVEEVVDAIDKEDDQ